MLKETNKMVLEFCYCTLGTSGGQYSTMLRVSRDLCTFLVVCTASYSQMRTISCMLCISAQNALH